MFFALWKAERLKLRRSPVWLAFFILPIFPAFFGTVNYLNNLTLLDDEWYSLWTQHTLFSCYFFLPLVVGIYCAYLWRLEHNGHNWNQALTVPAPRVLLVLAKLTSALVMAAGMLLWTLVLFVASGKLCGITAPLPPELPLWFAGGLAGAAVVCSLQLFLGLLFRAFAVPVGLAMVGGIAGLAGLSKGFGLFCPYSLLCMGMKANNPWRELDYPAFALSCVLFFLLFTALSAAYLNRRDSSTGA